MRAKKGQAAMEFLMTYGWAILVVLIVIGALAYFGVLNPQQFLPKKCQFAQGLVCQDHKLVDGGPLTLQINNGLGNDITIFSFNFTADNGLVVCANNALNTNILAGAEENIVAACLPMNAVSGSRIKGSMTLGYKDLQSNFDHIIQGTLLTDIE